MAQGGGGKPPKEQLLRLFPLIALIFYEVSGGPFGCEDAVGASSPIIAVLGFIVFPLIWSVPEALITAEMAVMFPEDSGYVVWVTYAFGPYMGWTAGVFSWVSGMTDNALYPVLAVDYFSYIYPGLGAGPLRSPIIIMITIALTYLNYRGLVLVGRMAVFLTVFCMLPFVALILMAIPQIQPDLWQIDSVFEDAKQIHWPKYLNIIFWNVNYWDSISTLAGEVHNPATTIPKALFLAVILMVVAYVLPLLFGTGVCIPTKGGGCALASEWKDGYFSKVAFAVGGSPLQAWLLLGAALTNVGMFEAEMCSDSYQIYGMAERGLLPSICAKRSRYGTPYVGILMSACGVLFVSFKGFTRIVEMLNFLYCIAAIVEFAAFLKLRYSREDLHRGFRVPLPFWGCCLMLVLPTFMTCVVLYLASKDTVIVSIVVGIVGTLLYVFFGVCKKYQLLHFIESPSHLNESTPLVGSDSGFHHSGSAGHRSLILADRNASEIMKSSSLLDFCRSSDFKDKEPTSSNSNA